MEIFTQSMELMVIGMGTTFLFLIVMVGVMKALQYAVNILEGIFPQQGPAQNPEPSSCGVDSKTALAIALAKHHCR